MILPLCSKQEGTPSRTNRSDDVQRHMVRTYITHTGVPRTNFPEPKVSRSILWVRGCLKRFGLGSLDYSLLIFHKNNRFRRIIKRAVKSKYLSNRYIIIKHIPSLDAATYTLTFDQSVNDTLPIPMIWNVCIINTYMCTNMHTLYMYSMHL